MSVWNTLEWKEKAKAFIEKKKAEGLGFCEWCSSTENLVPAHKKKRGGYTHDEYMDLEKNCGVKCGKCNFMESKGYKLCPVCKEHYYKPKRKYEKMCWNCFIQTPFGQKVAERMEEHPEEFKKRRRRRK